MPDVLRWSAFAWASTLPSTIWNGASPVNVRMPSLGSTWERAYFLPPIEPRKYYSRGFPVCDRAAAQRDAGAPGVVTLRHLLPAAAGYPGPAASSRAL